LYESGLCAGCPTPEILPARPRRPPAHSARGEGPNRVLGAPGGVFYDLGSGTGKVIGS
jgi:hypothetical protein